MATNSTEFTFSGTQEVMGLHLRRKWKPSVGGMVKGAKGGDSHNPKNSK